ELPKNGASSREAEISTASVAAPATKTTAPSRTGGPYACAAERTSACSRSATRSSADSIPTERRTRLFGGANAASAVDACVIRARVVAVLAHPHCERLHSAQHEPAVERAGNRAERLLQEEQPLRNRRIVRRDEAADDVRVAAEVLRRRVQNDVRAEREWALQV